jgi:hypothetical protein
LPDTLLKALNYGVIGLCAIMIYLAWHLLRAEQTRSNKVRKDMLIAIYVFLAASLLTAVLVAYVQLRERGPNGDCDAAQVREAAERLRRSAMFRSDFQIVAEHAPFSFDQATGHMRAANIPSHPGLAVMEGLDVAGLVEMVRSNEIRCTPFGRRVALQLGYTLPSSP